MVGMPIRTRERSGNPPTATAAGNCRSGTRQAPAALTGRQADAGGVDRTTEGGQRATDQNNSVCDAPLSADNRTQVAPSARPAQVDLPAPRAWWASAHSHRD